MGLALLYQEHMQLGSLLPILCLMPAAQAVDYVKCEAMQKAQSRIQTSIREIRRERKLSLQLAAQEGVNQCSRLRGTPEWKTCVSTVVNSPEVVARYDVRDGNEVEQEIKRLENRVARVQADYEAEGCY